MLIVLEALAARAPGWCHGYELMKRTGLMSGTIYPLLMRMADQGLVEAQWHAQASFGRPPRHVYRLTAAGLALARDLVADRDAPGGAPCPA